MAGISKLNIKFCGSHCGISIGEDGSSQMGKLSIYDLIFMAITFIYNYLGLEDISMFRAIPNSVVLYPSDVISTEKAMQLVLNHKGITYIRTGRQPVD